MAHSASNEWMNEGSSRGVAEYRPFFCEEDVYGDSVFFTLFGTVFVDGMSAVAVMQTAEAEGTAIVTEVATATAAVAATAELAARSGRG